MVMREALEIYQRDIWSRYLDGKGEEIEYGLDSIGPTVTLAVENIPRMHELRREAEMLFLTSIYRLGASKVWDGYEVNWPINFRPDKDLDVGPLWGGDVRPMTD